MWGAKANRIADLEARLAVAQKPRVDAALAADSTARTENQRLKAELHATKARLATAETQLGDARQRAGRLSGSMESAAQRIATAETARVELAYLIAEHLTRGATPDDLRRRVGQVGHTQLIDQMAALIGDHTPEVTA